MDEVLVAEETIGAPIWSTNSDENTDEWEMANVTGSHACFFTRFEVLLDNEASLNVFENRELLKNVRRSTLPIVLRGVESNSKGVTVELEGDFNEIGTVFMSEKATANILSFAAQVDAGANIQYDQPNDRFTMTPANSSSRYIQLQQ